MINPRAISHLDDEILLQGEVGPGGFDWFDGLALASAGGQTRLLAKLPDQTALRALLERIFDLNIPLISVNQHTAEEEP